MARALLTSQAYGKRVGLEVETDDVPAIRRWLPFWWQDSYGEPERAWDLPSVRVAEAVIGQLELWVAEFAVDRVFVHAGVVAFDGRALLLPGRSFSGKTTLTAALLRAGAAYGSDEYAVLDSDGLVHPYPRPLSVREGADRQRVPAAELGARTFVEPMPVAAIAQLRYAPTAQMEVQDISRGTAVLRLFDNTVCAQSRSEAALDALVAATARATAVAGRRGDAEAAVPVLQDLLKRSG